MTELLALHPKTKVDMLVMSIPRPASGVPINALPGWDDVPLFSKLPMLKCPNNQIIFSRAKIGQKLWQAGEFRLYDPYCYIVRMDYDSLHDPHLKTFYSKENNLRRLRKIGKVTENNDVICTLREFNGYRRLLQRYHLDLIHKEIIRREDENSDRAMVFHAENIAKMDCQKFTTKLRLTRDHADIYRIKQEAEKSRQLSFRKKLDDLRKAIERIERVKALKKEILAEKTKLRDIHIKQRQQYANDMERKRIILLKKKYALREARLRFFRKRQFSEKSDLAMTKAIKQWERRLKSRTKHHQRNMKLLKKAELNRQNNIERRKQKLEKAWRRIQAGIARRSKLAKKRRKGRKIKFDSICTFFEAMQGNGDILSEKPSQFIRRLPRKGIQGLVQLVLELEDKQKNAELLMELPDGAIKVAQYILEVVIKKFKDDLSTDSRNMTLLNSRIDILFSTVKTDQIMKAALILKHTVKNCLPVKCHKATVDSTIWGGKHSTGIALSRFVSFGSEKEIGHSLQHIGQNVIMKSVRARKATPYGSLTSLAPVVLEFEEDLLEQRKSVFFYCTKEERIFIEHFYIKFKRALIVGVGRQVFNAVRCYKNHKIFNPRQELLDIDRQYLTSIMAKSILSYAVNSYNFYSNLRLCINALSADIIWDLQKTVLKPLRDPRYMNPPKCRCNYDCAGKKNCNRKK